MQHKEEYARIFIAEALEEYEKVNSYLTALERSPKDDKLLAEIFRNLHNLKANSSASGYATVSNLAHKLESIFSALRKHELDFKDRVIDSIYRGIDSLGEILNYINEHTQEKVLDQIILRELDGVLSNDPIPEIYEVLERKDIAHPKIILSDLISVEVKQLDALLNSIGELIINRDRIIALANHLEHNELQNLGFRLYKISNEIQQNIMDARLVNLGTLFNKFPRIIRDIAIKENKQVNLKVTGQDIKIDRSILHIISESMLHLIRNAVTHGIEPKLERKQKGKASTGNLNISAVSENEFVFITVSDDGSGIDMGKIKENALRNKMLTPEMAYQMKDPEILSMIFESGFSLAKEATEYSGRGMGLFIVKENIDSLGGVIKVLSKKNKGTTFEITVPTSITVKSALIFKVGSEFYAIPLFYIENVYTINEKPLQQWGNQLFYSQDGETIPLIYLYNYLNHSEDHPHKNELSDRKLYFILLKYNNRKIGFIPDSLYSQQNIVIKPLKKPVKNNKLFSGVTILGSGSICFLFDIPSVFHMMINEIQERMPVN